MKKLSILVLTVSNRQEYLKRLMSILKPQLTDEVELLIESDSGENSIGKKRNSLIHKSTGEYSCFVDDDDLVSFDYVSKILQAIQSKPDCIGMHLLHFNDGNLAGFTYHSIKYNEWSENRDFTTGFVRYYRCPNHLNPVRTELMKKVMFPETNWGEDRDYSIRLQSLIKTEAYIPEPIYYYLYRSKK